MIFFHTFLLNNLTSFLFCVRYTPFLQLKALRSQYFTKVGSFSTLSTLLIFACFCDYAFNTTSWWDCQISSSLDLFLTEYMFSKFLVIVLINLHVRGLFNLIYESQEFSPRETYKGSWKHFSFFSFMGFDLFHNHADIFTRQIPYYWRTCSGSLLLSYCDTFAIICI